MSVWMGIKLGLGVLLLAYVYRLGGDRARTAAEALHAAQMAAVVTQMEANLKASQSAQNHLQTVVDAYDRTKDLEPVTAGVVERLRLIQGAACRAVPGAPGVAGGVDPPGPLPAGVRRIDEATQRAFDAAAADAAELNAVIQLAPHPKD